MSLPKCKKRPKWLKGRGNISTKLMTQVGYDIDNTAVGLAANINERKQWHIPLQ